MKEIRNDKKVQSSNKMQDIKELLDSLNRAYKRRLKELYLKNQLLLKDKRNDQKVHSSNNQSNMQGIKVLSLEEWAAQPNSLGELDPIIRAYKRHLKELYLKNLKNQKNQLLLTDRLV
jgi:hypothetical protein